MYCVKFCFRNCSLLKKNKTRKLARFHKYLVFSVMAPPSPTYKHMNTLICRTINTFISLSIILLHSYRISNKTLWTIHTHPHKHTKAVYLVVIAHKWFYDNIVHVFNFKFLFIFYNQSKFFHNFSQTTSIGLLLVNSGLFFFFLLDPFGKVMTQNKIQTKQTKNTL